MSEKQYWDQLLARRHREYKQFATLEAIKKLLIARLSYGQKLKAIGILFSRVDDTQSVIQQREVKMNCPKCRQKMEDGPKWIGAQQFECITNWCSVYSIVVNWRSDAPISSRVLQCKCDPPGSGEEYCVGTCEPCPVYGKTDPHTCQGV